MEVQNLFGIQAHQQRIILRNGLILVLSLERVGYNVKKISMGLEGEDFAYYQKKIPGAFITVGTGLSYAHHHPEYQVDEKAILNCSKYFAKLAEGALKEILEKNYTPIKKARSAY